MLDDRVADHHVKFAIGEGKRSLCGQLDETHVANLTAGGGQLSIQICNGPSGLDADPTAIKCQTARSTAKVQNGGPRGDSQPFRDLLHSPPEEETPHRMEYSVAPTQLWDLGHGTLSSAFGKRMIDV